MSSERKWYLVYTHARAETTAAAHLERQGFQTYCPKYLKQRSHARRITTEPAPFFPRYIFVAMDIGSQRWRAVCSTIGVSHLVGCERGPAPIRDAVVAELRARENAAGFIKHDDVLLFRQGDRIRVCEGAFSAIAGLFDCMTDSGRVAVLLDLLGRKVRVVLSGTAISAA